MKGIRRTFIPIYLNLGQNEKVSVKTPCEKTKAKVGGFCAQVYVSYHIYNTILDHTMDLGIERTFLVPV